jgi:DNA polymerase elongation subunit (family B)
LNISPETKLGKIVTGDWKKDPEIEIKLVNGKLSKLETEKFKKFIKEEKISVSRAGVLYTQKFKGILPTLINRVYGERVESKKAMNKAKKTLSKIENELTQNKTTELLKQKKEAEDEVIYYNVLQSVLKLTLNSIYGIMVGAIAAIAESYNIDSNLNSQRIVITGGVLGTFFAYKALTPNVTVDFKPRSTNLKDVWYNVEKTNNYSTALWFLLTQKFRFSTIHSK